MDGVYAEADRIFGMLAIAERMLVLLDEFDEMVRARESATDVLSRFLTTAMLPKLHKINDNRRLVFIVATNHIEAFDVAIRRPGRFDVILQVMPPTVDEKLKRWSELTKTAIELDHVREKIEPLTFAETEMLVRRLRAATTQKEKSEILGAAYSKCTLRDAANQKGWQEICDEQSTISRVP